MNKKERDLELQLSKLKFESALRQGQSERERFEFFRKFAHQIEMQVPLAEAFLTSFLSGHFLSHLFVDNPSFLDVLDITTAEEIACLQIITDAVKLHFLQRLQERVSQSMISGYEASDNSRGFPNNMIFLLTHIEVGEENFSSTIDNLVDTIGKYITLHALRMMDLMNKVDFQVVIDSKGKVFTVEDSDRLMHLYAGSTSLSTDRMTQKTEKELLHTEGELEEAGDYTVSVMVGWDIKNTLPVFISIWGNKGLMSDGLDIRFLFESNQEGATPFPIPTPNREKSQLTWNNDHTKLEEYSEFSDSHWSREKYIQLPPVEFRDSQLKVWVNNQKWNSFGSIQKPEVAENKYTNHFLKWIVDTIRRIFSRKKRD